METTYYYVRVRFSHETKWGNTGSRYKALTDAQLKAAMLNRNYGPRLVYAVFTREGRQYKALEPATPTAAEG